MSLSSSGNFVSGLGPFAVLQQGVLTKTANAPLVVACEGILAGDLVLLELITATAGVIGEKITIQAGVSFTATSTDGATFAGTYGYAVVRSSAIVVNAPPPP
nr:MAG: hypothetical protein [Lake Baikal virophage 13]